MDDTCSGCLSTGRNLFFIEETGYQDIYSQILSEISVFDSSGTVQVCWECCGRLRAVRLFKRQVQQSYALLSQKNPPCGVSCLATEAQYNYSYPEAPDIEVEDVEEHFEPEGFATALSIVPPTDANKRIQKKKPKIKLKETKVKKKRKKKCQVIEPAADSDHEDSHFQDNLDDIQMDEGRIKHNNSEVKNDFEEPATEDTTKLKANGTPPAKRAPIATSVGTRPQCQECGKVFSSKKTYRYHLNVLHKGQNQHPCGRCGKVYQWKSNLGRHMRTHRALDDGELFCALCDRSFASVATYRQHLRISRRHVQEQDYSFSCEMCGKRFVNKTRLRDHVDWEHLQRIKFRCTLCDKAFKCHTSLYVHKQNVHAGRDVRDNLCHVCGKSYQNAAKLKYHITAMHTGETPYRCGKCDAAFGWYSSLYRHTREVHDKMKGLKKAKKESPRLAAPLPPPLH